MVLGAALGGQMGGFWQCGQARPKPTLKVRTHKIVISNMVVFDGLGGTHKDWVLGQKNLHECQDTYRRIFFLNLI
jgi:hypothetical protein